MRPFKTFFQLHIRNSLPIFPWQGVLNEIGFEAEIGFRYRPVHWFLNKSEVAAGTSSNFENLPFSNKTNLMTSQSDYNCNQTNTVRLEGRGQGGLFSPGRPRPAKNSMFLDIWRKKECSPVENFCPPLEKGLRTPMNVGHTI